jgi:shikimate kinase
MKEELLEERKELYREYVRRIIEGDDNTPLEEMLSFRDWSFRYDLGNKEKLNY